MEILLDSATLVSGKTLAASIPGNSCAKKPAASDLPLTNQKILFVDFTQFETPPLLLFAIFKLIVVSSPNTTFRLRIGLNYR